MQAFEYVETMSLDQAIALLAKDPDRSRPFGDQAQDLAALGIPEDVERIASGSRGTRVRNHALTVTLGAPRRRAPARLNGGRGRGSAGPPDETVRPG